MTRQYRNVHLCVLEKFIPSFVRFVEEEFGGDEHFFILTGKLTQFMPPPATNSVHLTTFFARLSHLGTLYRSERIFLHGLYDAKYLYLLALQPWLLKKCCWLIWGSDLYQYLDPRDKFKQKLKEKVRAFVIRRLGYAATYIPGDHDLARQWYASGARRFDCLMYESNLYKPSVESVLRGGGTINILLGNSAFRRNNHIEAMERMAGFVAANVRIFAPLSYGPRDYAQEVALHGRQIFGDRFSPMLDFMDREDYDRFMETIDIAVFNNTQQQAMGNIISLLGKGKTVFLRPETSSWKLFEQLGIVVKDARALSTELISEEQARCNRKVISEAFSRERLRDQWKVMFSV